MVELSQGLLRTAVSDGESFHVFSGQLDIAGVLAALATLLGQPAQPLDLRGLKMPLSAAELEQHSSGNTVVVLLGDEASADAMSALQRLTASSHQRVILLQRSQYPRGGVERLFDHKLFANNLTASSDESEAARR